MTWPRVLFVLIACGLVALCFAYVSQNPYAEAKWVEDYPGAGDRYRTFTPVLKTDGKTVVGPTVGADYGALSFEDVNGDGIKEAVVETEGSFTFEEFHPERHTLRYQRDAEGRPQFKLIKSEDLP